MSQVAVTGVENYIDKIEHADSRREKAVKKIRLGALHDTELDDIARAVIGFTGSSTRLDKYRKLNNKTIQNIGKPLLVVSRVVPGRFEGEGKQVDSAYGGIIAGGLEVKFWEPVIKDETPNITSAHMYVPVLPVVAYQNFKHSGGVHTYLNEDTDKFDKEGNIGKLEIAKIGFDHGRGPSQAGDYPVSDSIHPNVCIGRSEIYQHELFRRGISDLLELVENAAA